MFNFFNDQNQTDNSKKRFELYLKNGNVLCINNVKRLLSFDDIQISVGCEGGCVRISGKSLKLKLVEHKLIEISGEIKGIEVL